MTLTSERRKSRRSELEALRNAIARYEEDGNCLTDELDFIADSVANFEVPKATRHTVNTAFAHQDPPQQHRTDLRRRRRPPTSRLHPPYHGLISEDHNTENSASTSDSESTNTEAPPFTARASDLLTHPRHKLTSPKSVYPLDFHAVRLQEGADNRTTRDAAVTSGQFRSNEGCVHQRAAAHGGVFESTEGVTPDRIGSKAKHEEASSKLPASPRPTTHVPQQDKPRPLLPGTHGLPLLSDGGLLDTNEIHSGRSAVADSDCTPLPQKCQPAPLGNDAGDEDGKLRTPASISDAPVLVASSTMLRKEVGPPLSHTPPVPLQTAAADIGNIRTREGAEWRSLFELSSMREAAKPAIQAGEEYLTEHVTSIIRENASLAAQLVDIKSRVRAHEATIEHMESTAKQQTETIEHCRSQMSGLALIPIHEDTIKRLEAQCSSKNELLAELEASLAKARGKQRDANAGLELVKRNHAKRIETMEQDHIRDLRELKAEHDAKASAAASKMQGFTSKIVSLQELVAQATGAAESKTAEAAAAMLKGKKAAATVAALEAEKQQHHEMLAAASLRIGSAIRLLHRVHADNIGPASSRHQECQQADTVTTTTLENDLQQLDNACSAVKKHLQEEAVKKAGEIEDLIKEKAAYQAKAAKYKAKVQDKTRDRQRLVDDTDELTKQLSRKQAECLQLNSQLTTFRLEATRFEASLNSVRQEASENAQECSSIAEKLETSEAARKVLQDAVDKAESASAQSKAHAQRADKAKKDEEARVQQLERMLTSTQDDVSKLSKQLRDVAKAQQEERARMAKKITNLESDLLQVTEARSDLAEQLSRLQQARETTEERNAARVRELSQKLEDCQERHRVSLAKLDATERAAIETTERLTKERELRAAIVSSNNEFQAITNAANHAKVRSSFAVERELKHNTTLPDEGSKLSRQHEIPDESDGDEGTESLILAMDETSKHTSKVLGAQPHLQEGLEEDSRQRSSDTNKVLQKYEPDELDLLLESGFSLTRTTRQHQSDSHEHETHHEESKPEPERAAYPSDTAMIRAARERSAAPSESSSQLHDLTGRLRDLTVNSGESRALGTAQSHSDVLSSYNDIQHDETTNQPTTHERLAQSYRSSLREVSHTASETRSAYSYQSQSNEDDASGDGHMDAVQKHRENLRALVPVYGSVAEQVSRQIEEKLLEVSRNDEAMQLLEEMRLCARPKAKRGHKKRSS
ncbi:hypothetical protein DIPPA_12222 [Diplonema papillatum]|nr:hypothetical protein DIPPA_12222 [Diplonema papillatum]